jgi:hypothetical protein
MSEQRTDRHRLPTFRYWGRIGLLLWRLSPWKVVGLAVATLSVSVVPALQLALTASAVQTVADAVAAQDVDAAYDRILLIGMSLVGVSVLSHLAGTWQQSTSRPAARSSSTTSRSSSTTSTTCAARGA